MSEPDWKRIGKWGIRTASERIAFALMAFIGALQVLVGSAAIAAGVASGTMPAWVIPRLILLIVFGLIFLAPATFWFVFRRRISN